MDALGAPETALNESLTRFFVLHDCDLSRFGQRSSPANGPRVVFGGFSPAIDIQKNGQADSLSAVILAFPIQFTPKSESAHPSLSP